VHHRNRRQRSFKRVPGNSAVVLSESGSLCLLSRFSIAARNVRSDDIRVFRSTRPFVRVTRFAAFATPFYVLGKSIIGWRECSWKFARRQDDFYYPTRPTGFTRQRRITYQLEFYTTAFHCFAVLRNSTCCRFAGNEQKKKAKPQRMSLWRCGRSDWRGREGGRGERKTMHACVYCRARSFRPSKQWLRAIRSRLSNA